MKSPLKIFRSTNNFFAWLKEAVINLLSLLKGLFLVAAAFFILALAIPAGAIHYFCTIGKKKQKAREIMQNSGIFSYLVALAIDHLGNVITPGLWNWLFLKNQDTPFPFGIPGQSLSQVLGFNYALDNLNEWGINMRHDLNTIDTDHCEKAVLSAVYEAKHLLEKYRRVQARMETIERTKEFLEKYK